MLALTWTPNPPKMEPSWDLRPKLGSKIHQLGVQNPSSWGPKTKKISLGRGLGEDLGHQDPFKELPEKIKKDGFAGFWGDLGL